MELIDEITVIKIGGSLGIVFPRNHVDFHKLSEGSTIKLLAEINKRKQKFGSFWNMNVPRRKKHGKTNAI